MYGMQKPIGKKAEASVEYTVPVLMLGQAK